MTHTRMTRWIEIADARQACEAAGFDHGQATEVHRLHLGRAIARIPGLIRQGVAGQRLTHFGHALACVRPPLPTAPDRDDPARPKRS